MKQNNTQFIYGLHAVKMALEHSPQDILSLWVVQERQDQRIKEVLALAQDQGIVISPISKAKLLKKVGDVAHQGVIACCRAQASLTEVALLAQLEASRERVLLLILDGVQDPHNVGACLRTANAFGVMAVVAPKDRAAPLTEAAKKVASGAATSTPFVVVNNLHRFLIQLKEVGVWLLGLDDVAGNTISEIDTHRNLAIVMGGEGEGLRRLTKEACDYLASIPMRGQVESLNVSVAAGIAMYVCSEDR